MVHELAPLDISDMPELRRLAEEVRDTNTPRVLRRGDEDVAVIVPAPPKPSRKRVRRGGKDWKPSKEELEAFYSSAGGWADMDTDTLLANIYADRRASNRPPREL